MKIVTLLPGATELVCDLGLGEHLVGISHECDFPTEVTHLPRLTSSIIPEALDAADIDTFVVDAVREHKPLYQVDGDLLATLSPDLVITQGVCDVCAVNSGTVAATMQLIPDVVTSATTVLSLNGKDVAGILQDLRRIGDAANAAAAATTRIAQLEAAWSALGDTPRTTANVLMLEWPDPPFYGGHWVPELVAQAGGIDIAGTAGQDSGRISWEQIAARDPELIFVIACGFDLERNASFAQDLYNLPNADSIRALRQGAVWACDANSYFSRPTPRVLNGAQQLQHVISGGQHPDTRRVPPSTRR